MRAAGSTHRLAALFASRTGIDLERGNQEPSLERFVRQRSRELGLPLARRLRRLLLAGDTPELRRLINATTIGLSWLFRDAEQLAAVEQLFDELARRRPPARGLGARLRPRRGRLLARDAGGGARPAGLHPRHRHQQRLPRAGSRGQLRRVVLRATCRRACRTTSSSTPTSAGARLAALRARACASSATTCSTIRRARSARPAGTSSCAATCSSISTRPRPPRRWRGSGARSSEDGWLFLGANEPWSPERLQPVAWAGRIAFRRGQRRGRCRRCRSTCSSRPAPPRAASAVVASARVVRRARARAARRRGRAGSVRAAARGERALALGRRSPRRGPLRRGAHALLAGARHRAAGERGAPAARRRALHDRRPRRRGAGAARRALPRSRPVAGRLLPRAQPRQARQHAARRRAPIATSSPPPPSRSASPPSSSISSACGRPTSCSWPARAPSAGDEPHPHLRHRRLGAVPRRAARHRRGRRRHRRRRRGGLGRRGARPGSSRCRPTSSPSTSRCPAPAASTPSRA